MYSVPVERNIRKMVAIQTEQAAAHQADDHGNHRVAASAQAAGQSVHYAAQEVGSADDLHPGQAGSHHGFIRGVEVQQDLTAKVSAAAQEQARHSDAEHSFHAHVSGVLLVSIPHAIAMWFLPFRYFRKIIMIFANQIVARGTFFVNLYNDSYLMHIVVMCIK